MTGIAWVESGEVGWSQGEFAEGGNAVSPVSSEARWDDAVSHHQKYQEGEDKEFLKSKKMPSVLDDIDQPPPPVRRFPEDP